MVGGNEPIHINAERANIAPLVLMPGDPLRAKYIAENFLTEAKEVCNLRNMLGFTGTYKGVSVTVMGSGMGIPSMGIYSWELFNYYDVKKIIRIGTAGVVSPKIKIPELMLCEKAYTESNFAYSFDNSTTKTSYPTSDLNKIIVETAEKLNYKLHVGDIVTMDVFGPYLKHDEILKRVPKELNIIGEEMEAFGLFYIANYFKKDAACILTAVDSKFSNIILSSDERQNSLNEMITLALESIIK